MSGFGTGLKRETVTTVRPAGPEHGTRSRAVLLGLCRIAMSAQYRIAVRYSTLEPVRYETQSSRSRPFGRPGRTADFKAGVIMQGSKLSAYRAFQAAANAAPLPRQAAEKVRTCAQSQPSLGRARELAGLPPLAPYQRCTCGSCDECRDNAKWDRIFAKFEVKEREVRGTFQCALADI